MATISKSGMIPLTDYNLGQTLLPGSVITEYTITLSETVTIQSGYPANMTATIYNGSEAVTQGEMKPIGYGRGPFTINDMTIYQNKVLNASAFQSSDVISLSAEFGGTGISGDPTFTVTITYTPPTLIWSDPTLSLAQDQNTLQVTATIGGTATHSSGETVTYYLYEGSTQIGTFSNGTLTFTSTVGSHTYKTVASAGGLTADGTTASITVVEQDKCTVGYYDGTEFVESEVFRYDGTNFVQMKPYYYDGTSWRELQQ